jgi:hypothetical protein
LTKKKINKKENEKKERTLFDKFIDFGFRTNESALVEMTDKEYKETFIKGKSKKKIEKAYNRAWEAKNFEIENYWKRANYFWAFQVASFAGYFSVLSSEKLEENPQISFVVICIGLVTAFAWSFTNRGSKTWQRHWEIHVDMLEEKITGPLYKTVTSNKTFSVSKINDIVSRFFIMTWFILGTKYFIELITFNPKYIAQIDYVVILSTIGTIYFVCAMYFGHGRGLFGKRKVKFYKRHFDVK